MAVVAQLISCGIDPQLAEDASVIHDNDFERALQWCTQSASSLAFYRTVLLQLLEMGFPRETCLEGMRHKGVNSEMVMDWILSGCPAAPREVKSAHGAATAVLAGSGPMQLDSDRSVQPRSNIHSFWHALIQIEGRLSKLAEECAGILALGAFKSERQYLFLREALQRDVILRLDELTLPRISDAGFEASLTDQKAPVYQHMQAKLFRTQHTAPASPAVSPSSSSSSSSSGSPSAQSAAFGSSSSSDSSTSSSSSSISSCSSVPPVSVSAVLQSLRGCPALDPRMRTLLLAGCPGAGKSSFLRQVAPEATTVPLPLTVPVPVTVHVGRFEEVYLRWQILHAPGALDTQGGPGPGTAVAQALSQLGLSATLLYFLDLTPHATHTLQQQVATLRFLQSLFPTLPVLLVTAKADSHPEAVQQLDGAAQQVLAELLSQLHGDLLVFSNHDRRDIRKVVSAASSLLLAHRGDGKLQSAAQSAAAAPAHDTTQHAQCEAPSLSLDLTSQPPVSLIDPSSSATVSLASGAAAEGKEERKLSAARARAAQTALLGTVSQPVGLPTILAPPTPDIDSASASASSSSSRDAKSEAPRADWQVRFAEELRLAEQGVTPLDEPEPDSKHGTDTGLASDECVSEPPHPVAQARRRQAVQFADQLIDEITRLWVQSHPH